MALLDLSLVTQALVSLVKEGIKASDGWSGPDPDVSGLPPDLLAGGTTGTVGIYLYHVTEDAAHKNQPWPQRPTTPSRFSPMGINLHYLVTAQAEHKTEPWRGPLREQLLMGLALKVLHDYPIVDDATQVRTVTVFPPALRDEDNRIRIQGRPVPANEAVSYWTAGTRPMRLSSYYEVSVVLLEPERPETGSGRVLARRVQLFTGGIPRLSTSRSTMSFTIPGESEPRQVEAQPAQVAYGEELVLIGENLTGDSVTLRVRGATWTDPVDADAGWGGVATGDRFFATARATIGSRTVVPGTYEASLRVTSGGADRPTNTTPFTVVPIVNVPATIPATTVFSISGSMFQHAEIPPETVRVMIGSADLRPRVVPGPPLAAGQFEVVNATRIDVFAPAGQVPGSRVPVRVVVNGAESAPRWAVVT